MTRDTLLVFDNAVSYGGSIEVAKVTAKAAHEQGLKPVIIHSMPKSQSAMHLKNYSKAIKKEPIFNYQTAKNAKLKIRSFRSKWLQRLLLMAYSAIELAGNLPYEIWMLWFLCVRRRNCIVHSNNNRQAIIYSRLLGIPCVYQAHGLAPNYKKFSTIVNRCQNIIAISKSVEHSLIEAGVQPGRIKLIYNPIRFDEEPRYVTRETTKLTISHVGRTVPWKGQLELLQALTHLRSIFPKIQVNIVGDDLEKFGEYLQELKQYCHKNELDKVVKFHGHVDDIMPIFQSSDIFVHSSIEPEPFGLVITEAAQSGCAIICSNYGAGPEILVDGESALIIDPKNTKEFAEAIGRLVQSKELRVKLSHRASERVNKLFSQSTYIAAVGALYNELK